MSRDKSISFIDDPQVQLDVSAIHLNLGTGKWEAVVEALRAEAQLPRDPETGRPRPKKASEFTLRWIGEFLHMMRGEIVRDCYNISSLAVSEQCLRVIRGCAASGMKSQTYICKDLNVLDDMLAIFTQYQDHCEEIVNEDVIKSFDSCMIALIQTLGNLVVNNPFNQTIIWEKLGTNILNALVGQNEKIASCSAMIVYNILLGQPNVLPDDVLLLNALCYMYTDGNSEFPHLIIEYLIGVENSYIEKLYNRLEPYTRILILNLAYNILTSVETQDINVSVNFIKFISHEFKVKSDCILKTVDKYLNSIEPQEVVYLLDILATASSMETYMECLQSDVSLFINCAFLLVSIHKLGKQEDNFFSSINKLYAAAGKTVPGNSTESVQVQPLIEKVETVDIQEGVKKCDSADLLQCNETISECTESESSEQYFECTDQVNIEKMEQHSIPQISQHIENKSVDPIINNIANVFSDKNPALQLLGQPNVVDRRFSDASKIDEHLLKAAFAKNIRTEITQPLIGQQVNMIGINNNQKEINLARNQSLENKIEVIDDMEPPLITDSPEEILQIEQKQTILSNNKRVILDNSMYKKENIGIPLITNPSSKNSSRSISRQQSVEPGLEASEALLKEMTVGLQQLESNPTIRQPVTNIPMQHTDFVQNIENIPPKSTTEPIPVKKPQNISSEFDLNEKLQKILGTPADKTIRSENIDINKDHNQAVHQRIEQAPAMVSSPIISNLTVSVPIVDNSVLKPKVQVKAPNVKIDSPENYQKTKLGNFENTGPKRSACIVESVEQHVAFGFKATLIRTLGNLCWKNQINKRQIRELGVIPVLLDCANIDARNPLIMQWVILAVRNLCENCPENQEIISSLTLREPVNNEILQEMGLTLHMDSQNNTIKLAPLLKKENLA